jgi:hypothetical protein
MSASFIQSLHIDVPTPTYIIYLDIIVSVLMLAEVVARIKSYFERRKRFIFYSCIANIMLFIVQAMWITLGLGFRHVFNPVNCWKAALLSESLTTPIYIMVILRRSLAFPDLMPQFLAERKWYIASWLIVFTVNCSLLGPIYAMLPTLDYYELKYPWLKYYVFIGWEIWSLFVVVLDTSFNYFALRKVVELKRGLNSTMTKTESGLTPAERKLYFFALLLLSFSVISDVISQIFILTLTTALRLPDLNEVNMLHCMMVLHIVFMFTFFMTLARFIRNKPNTSKSPRKKFHEEIDMQIISKSKNEFLLRQPEDKIVDYQEDSGSISVSNKNRTLANTLGSDSSYVS